MDCQTSGTIKMIYSLLTFHFYVWFLFCKWWSSPLAEPDIVHVMFMCRCVRPLYLYLFAFWIYKQRLSLCFSWIFINVNAVRYGRVKRREIKLSSRLIYVLLQVSDRTNIVIFSCSYGVVFNASAVFCTNRWKFIVFLRLSDRRCYELIIYYWKSNTISCERF